jgi:PPOX class probable F420-dependent enzyme
VSAAGTLRVLFGTVVNVTVDEALAFIRTNHRGVLATARKDGQPQLSPVTVGVDDDGSLIISTRETAIKTLNVRRTGRASVCVFEDAFVGAWVQAEGAATIESLPEAMEALVRYYRLLAGEHPDWDDYRRAMVRDRRVLMRIRVERVGPQRAG